MTTRGGYTDFGGIRIPVLPTYMVLTDRADGTLWSLSHDASHTHFTINSDLSWDKYSVVYGPYEGPYVGGFPGFTLKLYIRNAHLGYDVEELPIMITSRNNARIMSRRGFEPFTCEVRLPVDWINGSAKWSDGHGLIWEGFPIG